MHKVQLELTPTGDWSRVLVDGADIADAVRSLTVRAGGGNFTSMTLQLNLHDATPVDGELDVLIPDATRELLVRLGWTPPDGQTP